MDGNIKSIMIVNRRPALSSFHRLLIGVSLGVMLSKVDIWAIKFISGLPYWNLLILIGLLVTLPGSRWKVKLTSGESAFFVLLLGAAVVYHISFIYFGTKNFSDSIILYLHIIATALVISSVGSGVLTLAPALFFGSALTCGSLVWEIYFPGTFAPEIYRAAGFATDPNLGAFSLTSLSVLTIYMNSIGVLKRIHFSIILGVMMYLVFFTGSRASMLILLLLVSFSLFNSISRSLKGVGSVAILIAPILVLVWSVDISKFEDTRLLDRFIITTSTYLADDIRYELFFEYVDLVASEPFGIGRAENQAKLVDAHNSALNIASEAGIFAAIFFLAAIAVQFSSLVFALGWKSVFLILAFSVVIMSQNNVFFVVRTILH